MQQRISLLSPALFMIFLTMIVPACSRMKPPEPRGMEEFRISRIGLKSSSIGFRLMYYNPNSAGITLKNADGDAWIDNEFAGHFSVDSLVRIHGRDDFSLPVTMQLEMNQVLRTSSAILLGKVVTLRLEGKARLKKGGISFNYPISYEGQQDLGRMGY